MLQDVCGRGVGSLATKEKMRKGAEWRANKLTASEYDETSWSARTFMAFTTQRLSVAVQYSAAQEEGGRGARPVGGGRPTSGALDGRRGA